MSECVKLNGAMELAPSLGLSRRIVDLVSSGATLKANGLVETSVIMQISASLVVNRAAFKMRSGEIVPLVEAFRKAVEVRDAARSEERSVGKECVSRCRSRGTSSLYKKKNNNK